MNTEVVSAQSRWLCGGSPEAWSFCSLLWNYI